MGIRLRPYQATAINEAVRRFPKRVCLCMPVGSGKTLTASILVLEFGKRTLWVAHRAELVHQAATSLRRVGLRVGLIMAGERPDPYAPIQVASLQTVTRRTFPSADLVVIDECHHVRSTSYERLVEAYPNAYLLGLTATPFRLDGKGLGDVFDELVVGAQVDDLCTDGTLVEPLVYAPPAPNLDGVHRRGGDFVREELSATVDKPKLVGDIVQTWRRHAEGKRTVAFAVDVQHSRHIVEAFAGAGVAAAHLDGDTDRDERARTLARWRTGQLTVVSNVELFGEGFDLPALECAILARPTASLCLHLQQIGRVMRSSDGKEGAIVLDHVGNHHRHGRVTDRLEYSLSDRIRKPSSGEGRALFRQCKRCYVICDLRAEKCPACGYVFEKVGRGELEQVGGELEQLRAPREGAPFPERLAFWNDCERLRVEYGYRESFSVGRYKNRFGVWPNVVGGRLVETAPTASDVPWASKGDAVKREAYFAKIRELRADGRKEGAAWFWFIRQYGLRPPWPRPPIQPPQQAEISA